MRFITEMVSYSNRLYAGLDVGSTTVKIAVMDPATKEFLYSDYQRHNADQSGTVYGILSKLADRFPGTEFRIAVCGSGGHSIAEKLGLFFIQEVVANSLVIREYFTDVRVSIELGGQDAKVIFFNYDNESKQLIASDMRMNGSCAGGTGAFIDQVAELLSIKTEEFGALAEKGQRVYEISGRCGVFAKTDIQPLMNQGVSKEDIALSSLHAIVKQTIGGLAQGMEIKPRVIFEGGPLTFNPKLIEVFKERLSLKDNEIIIPERPEIIVAYGAALSIDLMLDPGLPGVSAESLLKKLEKSMDINNRTVEKTDQLFFKNQNEKDDFFYRHGKDNSPYIYAPDEKCRELDVFIGIDAGSTTSKFAVIDRKGRLVDSFYSSNHGEPLKVIKYALIRLWEKYTAMGIELNVAGLGTTGYGEILFAKGFSADYHTVETVAHAEAAQFFEPDVSFILDIGGQDMKAINLRKGIVTGIVLNEACSAGCGSFVETYAKSLGVSVERIAELAFKAKNPSRLGSRCTVFMNSSIITEQKNGKRTEDILAGISRSIIENVFTKVVRISNFNDLGEKIVVQGGTFKNDAVLRAFEQYTARNVIRAPFPGEMGAFGIALLVKKYAEEKEETEGIPFRTAFKGFSELEKLDYVKKPSVICSQCSNNCSRTVIAFSNGNYYVTGNRCDRGELIDGEDTLFAKQLSREQGRKIKNVPDMIKLHNQLLLKDYPCAPVLSERKVKIGIPQTLEFWNSMPFWKTLYRALGFEVIVSGDSSYDIFEKGLKFVPSDTACFPAKLVHGHIEDLAHKGVDRIFLPMLIRLPREHNSAEGNHTCVMLQGYPIVVEKSNDIQERYNVELDKPVFHWYNEKLKNRQIMDFLQEYYNIDRKSAAEAIRQADEAMSIFKRKMLDEGAKILKSLEGSSDFAVVLAGRPYHSDMLVNHNLSRYFISLGIPVLTLDSLPGLEKQDINDVRMDTTITFHTRMECAAIAAAQHPNLEIVQIVSFGCGHDAIISDEMIREIRKRSTREMLILKLDEGESAGPLNIRIKSFIETIKARRARNSSFILKRLVPEKRVVYTRKDRKEKVILAPNLSQAFTYLVSSVCRKDGIRMEPLSIADERAIELGKKYVHNDICFPAQINIGEALACLEKNIYDPSTVAIGLAKNCEACRAGQYSVLARKALDEAGYPQVPIVTTGIDNKKIHPGFKLTLKHQLRILWGITYIDGLEMMLRRVRPYEKTKGLCDSIFNYHMKRISDSIDCRKSVLHGMFEEAIEDFNNVETGTGVRRPRVGIVGEILVNYHPAANCYIESYLELNGMEVVQPAMHDFFRKTVVIEKEIGRRKMAPNHVLHYLLNSLTDIIYGYVNNTVWNTVKKNFRYAEIYGNIHDAAELIKPLIDITYVGAEGWKLPGEILHMVHAGVNSFVIVQPFGCLPNHITGRGMIKAIKKIYPHVQIIALDYDPDTSIANVENRLQMLIINAREMEKHRIPAHPVPSENTA